MSNQSEAVPGDPLDFGLKRAATFRFESRRKHRCGHSGEHRGLIRGWWVFARACCVFPGVASAATWGAGHRAKAGAFCVPHEMLRATKWRKIKEVFGEGRMWFITAGTPCSSHAFTNTTPKCSLGLGRLPPIGQLVRPRQASIGWWSFADGVQPVRGLCYVGLDRSWLR